MNLEGLPKHVAIIMDGNGRWAQQHKIQIALGHQAGVESLRDIIRESSDIGINTLSLYAFSTENWRRSEKEVNALMALLLRYFESEIDELDEKNVRIRILGDKQGLPEPQRNAVIRAEERTKNNTGLNLCIALNYGGRAEILRAARSLAQQVKNGRGHRRGGVQPRTVHGGPAGRGPADPYQRGAAPERFPALAVLVRGIRVSQHALA